jgi:large subunit ribosomal protein L24
VLIEGLNLRTKHLRKSADAPQGGVIEKEAWLSASNVQLFDSTAGRGVRTRISGTGTDKRRVSVKNNEPLGAKK